MEKTKLSKQTSLEAPNKHVIWDCGSSLYDSFELKAFEKQLQSAIVSRTLSMPHLSNRRLPPPPPPPSDKKGASRVSWSFHKVIRAVFRPKNSSNSCIKNISAISPVLKLKQQRSKEGFYHVVYEKSPALSTIPEVHEFDHVQVVSPDLKSSFVRRTASDRFSAANRNFGY